MKTRIIGCFHFVCRAGTETDNSVPRDTTFQNKFKMEVNIIELARQCPEVTISVKASDLVEMGKTLKDELLQDLRGVLPETPTREDDSFLTREETMKKLRVSSATIWRWKKCGYLVPVQLGAMDRYRISDINAILIKKGGAL